MNSDGKPQLTDDLLDAFEASLGEANAEEGGRQITLKKHVLTIKGDDGRSVSSYPFPSVYIVGRTESHYQSTAVLNNIRRSSRRP